MKNFFAYREYLHYGFAGFPGAQLLTLSEDITGLRMMGKEYFDTSICAK